MDVAEFEDLVDRCGDDLGRWPPERRDAAQALLTRSEAARSVLRQAAELRAMFAAAPRVRAPADLAARILALAATEPPAPPPPPPPSGWRGLMERLTAVWPASTAPLDAREPVGANWRLVVMLGGCFVAGLALGGSGLLTGAASRGETRTTAANELYAPILR